MTTKPFQLKRTKQCAKCPWKQSTDPMEIPDSYSIENHKALKNTIATPDSPYTPATLHVMACHESYNEEPYHCVGWLFNQLGEGNNIALRLHMRNCTNAQDLKVFGKQHIRFEDTLPTKKSDTV